MSDTQAFDALYGSDVAYFLSYFKNVAKVDSKGEERTRTIITYLRGETFKFYFYRLLYAAC